MMATGHTTARTDDWLVYPERFLRDQTLNDYPCHDERSSKTRTALSRDLFDCRAFSSVALVD